MKSLQKNLVPAISVEGFEEATDGSRGNGTYEKAVRAMGYLKERKLPFGISCCYTSQNLDSIASDAFFDQMIDFNQNHFLLFPVSVSSLRKKCVQKGIIL